MSTDLSAEAVDVAAAALSEHIDSGEMRPRILAHLMLEAARPHLIAEAVAAERERITQLIERHAALGYKCSKGAGIRSDCICRTKDPRFLLADLLRQDGQP